MLFCILGVNTSGNQNPKTRTLATPPSTGMQRKFQKQTKNNKNICNFWPNENVTWQIAAGRKCAQVEGSSKVYWCKENRVFRAHARHETPVFTPPQTHDRRLYYSHLFGLN